MKNKQANTLVPEISSLNYDIIKDRFDEEYENKLYADGFRKIEISVNGEKCTTLWGLRSDDPLKDDYLELSSNGDVERFEIVYAEYLPMYSFHQEMLDASEPNDEDEPKSDDEGQNELPF